MARGAALWISLLVPCAAHAQYTGDATLVYERGDGAADCPEEQGVRDAVVARVGHDPFATGAATTVTLRVARDGRALVATVTVLRGAIPPTPHALHGTPGRCDELVDAAALAISLALTQPATPPHLATPPQPTTPPTDTGLSPPPEPSPPPPLHTPPPRPAAARALDGASAAPPEPAHVDVVALQLGALVLGTLGPTPSVSGGLALSGGVRHGPFSAALEARADVPTAASSFREAFFAGTLVACGHIAWLGVCGAGTFGALHGDSAGEQLTTPYAAAGARVLGDLALTPELALRVALAIDATLVATDVHVGGERVWGTPVVSGWLGIGIVATLK